MEEFNRLILQIGNEKFEKLQKSNILLFGLGGVGGSIAETLVRSGIGSMTIIDGDTVDKTNINRQIIATHSVIGKNKVQVCAERLMDINPKLSLQCFGYMYPNENIDIDFSKFDYVIDAIDDFDAKILIIQNSKQNSVPIISAMGAGNKLNPLALKIDDISKSAVCPLAKKVRKKLNELGISDVKCAYSTEKSLPIKSTTISSNAFVPATMGILIAREVVMDLISD